MLLLACFFNQSMFFHIEYQVSQTSFEYEPAFHDERLQ